LQDVFGIFCWLGDCDEVAATEPSVKAFKISGSQLVLVDPSEEIAEEEQEDDDPSDDFKTSSTERILHCTKVLSWNDRDLARTLCSFLLKMVCARFRPEYCDRAKFWTSDCMFIMVMEKSWFWVSNPFRKGGAIPSFNTKTIPPASTRKYLLLTDLRGGRDGRVWVACSESRKVCVIKFFKSNIADHHEMAANELLGWKANKLPARKVILKGKVAVVMPYVKTLPKDVPLTSAQKELVKTHLKTLADEGLNHTDLKLNALAIISPVKGSKPRCISIDHASTKVFEKQEKAANLSNMLQQLKLTL